MIVVWGVDNGICCVGHGFRTEFLTSDEADLFIKTQCNKIPVNDIHKYGIYITDEYVGLDALMHFHNWKHTHSRFREESSKIKEVNIDEVKRTIDIEYQKYLRQQANTKMKIDHELRSMSNDEFRNQKQLFAQMGIPNGLGR